jgi:hypothetical protein
VATDRNIYNRNKDRCISLFQVSSYDKWKYIKKTSQEEKGFILSLIRSVQNWVQSGQTVRQENIPSYSQSTHFVKIVLNHVVSSTSIPPAAANNLKMPAQYIDVLRIIQNIQWLGIHYEVKTRRPHVETTPVRPPSGDVVSDAKLSVGFSRNSVQTFFVKCRSRMGCLNIGSVTIILYFGAKWLPIRTFHISSLIYVKLCLEVQKLQSPTNAQREFYHQIVTHSYMFRPCWVIFRENLLSLH